MSGAGRQLRAGPDDTRRAWRRAERGETPSPRGSRAQGERLRPASAANARSVSSSTSAVSSASGPARPVRSDRPCRGRRSGFLGRRPWRSGTSCAVQTKEGVRRVIEEVDTARVVEHARVVLEALGEPAVRRLADGRWPARARRRSDRRACPRRCSSWSTPTAPRVRGRSRHEQGEVADVASDRDTRARAGTTGPPRPRIPGSP